MKKLVFEEKNPTITSSELHSSDCIGLETSDGRRSFLLNTTPLNHISNDLYIISNKGLRDELEEVFSDKKYTLYVSETVYELMEWVYHMIPE